MSTLTIYGTAASRAFRVIWMAHELGLDYEHDPVDFRDGGNRKPDFLKINPNAHIPAIRDDKVTMCESLAINHYLAKRYPGPLTPKTLEDEAMALQWSLWAATEAEPHIVSVLRHTMMLPEDQRDPAVAAQSQEAVKPPMKVLNDALAGRDWLVGDDFSVADLNVAGVVGTALRLPIDMSAYPNVTAWLDRCMARPAAQAANEIRAKAAA